MSDRLLATKYAPPPIRPRSIRREPLLARLDEPTALTVVAAPAGYGKTTLVADWAARRTGPTAWVTLDEGDSDPSVFVAYVAAALRHALPELVLPEPAATLSGASARSTLVALVNALAASPEPVALVLDDYHLVGGPAVHDLVAFLANHLPGTLRLVVLTREDPALPLARHRARGQLTDIRAADLCFGTAEASCFFSETLRLDLGAGLVERLAVRTEGWPAGLQLAGLSLRGSADPDAFVRSFGASDRHVLDYLSEEVLASLPDDLRDFLVRTSVLERLTAPLCRALTGRTDAADVIVALERANLFLVPLDDRREWFRYHALFADLLRSELGRDDERELRGRAARWLGERGLLPEAIRQALAAGEEELAANLMEEDAGDALIRAEFQTVAGRCASLAAATLERHPGLRIAAAWAHFFGGDVVQAERESRDLDPGAMPPGIAGRLFGLRAWLGNRLDFPDTESSARQATQLLPPSDEIFVSLAWTTLGETLLGTDAPGSLAAFSMAASAAPGREGSALWSALHGNSAQAEMILGGRTAAIERCRAAIDGTGARMATLSGTIGFIHSALGMALYDGDELAAARQHLAIGREQCERAGMRVAAFGTPDWYEILTLHALHERDLAWRRLETAGCEAQRTKTLRVLDALPFLAVELALREGDVTRASSLGRDLPSGISGVRGNLNDFAPQVRARLRLAAGRAADALAIIEPHANWQRDGERFGRLVATLLIQAAVLERLGRSAEARQCVEEALARAAPEDIRRPFVAEPAVTARWLPELHDRSPRFVEDVLARVGVASAASRPHGGVAGPALAEPLSAREFDVLRLVAAGLSNDEIGRELYIGRGTAKWHVHNLLGKLGARDRVNLVNEARALGLLK